MTQYEYPHLEDIKSAAAVLSGDIPFDFNHYIANHQLLCLQHLSEFGYPDGYSPEMWVFNFMMDFSWDPATKTTQIRILMGDARFGPIANSLMQTFNLNISNLLIEKSNTYCL
jgi:hypothetical protein